MNKDERKDIIDKLSKIADIVKKRGQVLGITFDLSLF
jgi:predicted Zn-ribbon and HTH transcriptional regulator